MATRLTVLFLLIVAAVVSFQPSPSQADQGGSGSGGSGGSVCASLSHVTDVGC